jgi:hypothetical protein
MGGITRNTYLTFKQAAHEVVNWIQRAQGNVQLVELADILQKPSWGNLEDFALWS